MSRRNLLTPLQWLAPLRRSLRAALPAGCLWAVGCGQASPPPAPPAPSSGTAPAASAPATSAARCDDILTNVLRQLEPRSIGISSDMKIALQQLNDWGNRCGQAGEPPPAVPAPFAEKLPEAARENLAVTRYSESDGELLREATLFKSVAGYTTAAATNDRERVGRVFEHVVRNVALDNAGAELPFEPIDRYLLGIGTPADRAAIFASILRQSRFDVVLFEAEPREGETSRPLLIGVLYDNGLRLYDPLTGQPLRSDPAAADSPAATWTELTAKPELIERLSSPGWKHPLDAERVKTLVPRLAGPAAVWSTRMLRLQGQMAGETAVVAAEGLADGAGGPGLLGRLAPHLGEGDKLGAWERSTQIAAARRTLTDMQRELLERARLAWGAPVPFKPDETQQQLVPGRPSRTFLRLRLAQAAGAFDEAISEYPREVVLPCRALMNAPIPEVYKFQAIEAANEATYWMAVCQAEKGEHKIAADSAARYLRNSRQAVANVIGQLLKFSSRKIETFEKSLAAVYDAPEKADFATAVIAATREANVEALPEHIEPTIRGVLSTFRRVGASQLLLGKSLHDAGNLDAAKAALAGIAADSPQSPEARTLLQQWAR